MRAGKRMLAAVFSLILVLSFYGEVNAQEPLEIGLDTYAAEEGVLKLYVNHNQGEDFPVTADNVKVMFGNNEMVTQNISSLEEENVPISYKCVVDVSGSMSQERIDEAKAVIKDLANKKKSEDNIAITALGNELTQSEYLTDPAAIAEKADILTLTRQDTNLYYAIVQEIKALQTSDDVNRKKCLIIFSDGADDQATGITREEAENAVTESHIPVFTVGLLKNKDDNNAKEMAKVLGSFARISSGGEHFAPALGEGSTETIADSIIAKLNSSLVLEESLADVNVSGKEVVLKVVLSTAGGETAEDSINVPESDIKIIHEEQQKIQVTTEPVTEETTVEETMVEESTVPEETLEEPPEPSVMEQYGLYIIIGIVLLLVILAAVLIILKKKKDKTTDSAEQEDDKELSEDTPAFSPESETMPVENNRTIGGFESEGLTVAPSDMGSKTVGFTGKKYHLTLVRIGKNSEKKYDIDLDNTYTIGRSEAKCNLALPKDTALSGLHCTLLAEGGKIYIKDEKSTNGTFVNGVPISGKFELSQDDIILLGSYEYRIFWK